MEQRVSAHAAATYGETLRFSARFSGGSLRRATQVGPREYVLRLRRDRGLRSNASGGSAAGGTSWFYFSFGPVRADGPYTLHITGCGRMSTLYRQGRQPLLHCTRSGGAEADLNVWRPAA